MKGFLFQIKYCLIAGYLLLSVGCNEKYPNLLREEFIEPEVGTVENKVLYIVLDGVNGTALESSQPTEILKMTENALYSFDALLDIENYPTDNMLGWSNLLTGRKPSQHGAVGGGSLPNLEQNPTILTLAKKSQLIATSSLFYETFGSSATVASLESSDEEAFNKVKISAESSTKDLIMVEFKSAEVAAQTGGYSLSNGSYSQALKTLDIYIGALRDAVASRVNYKKENWLIVVASNKGGLPPSNTINNHFLNASKNVFAMYYTPKVTQRSYLAPDDFNFIADGLNFTYTGTNQSLLTLNSIDKFSIDLSGVNKGTTYQFKVKMKDNVGSSWPTLLSKTPPTGSVTGDTFEILSGSLSGPIQVKTKNANATTITNPFADGNWHTITVVYERVSTAQIRVRTYQDGVIGNTVTFNNNDQMIGRAYPLRIGRNNATVNGTPTAVFYDMKVYNIPLPEAYILNNYCKTEADKTSPYYGNLKGYWKLGNMQGNQISNIINPTDNTERFVATGNPSPFAINEFVGVFCPPFVDESFKVVPFALDNPFMIGNWLNVDKAALGKMDGKTWPFLYVTNQD